MLQRAGGVREIERASSQHLRAQERVLVECVAVAAAEQFGGAVLFADGLQVLRAAFERRRIPGGQIRERIAACWWNV